MSDTNTETTEPIGQAWCLCPYEWGTDDYVLIESSQGRLALCKVLRVTDGRGWVQIRYERLTKDELPSLGEP